MLRNTETTTLVKLLKVNTIKNILVNDQCSEEVPSSVYKQNYFLNLCSKNILVQWVSRYTNYMTVFHLYQSHGLYVTYITGFNMGNCQCTAWDLYRGGGNNLLDHCGYWCCPWRDELRDNGPFLALPTMKNSKFYGSNDY